MVPPQPRLPLRLWPGARPAVASHYRGSRAGRSVWGTGTDPGPADAAQARVDWLRRCPRWLQRAALGPEALPFGRLAASQVGYGGHAILPPRRSWRKHGILSAGIRSPMQKPKERTLIGQQRPRLPERNHSGMAGEIISECLMTSSRVRGRLPPAIHSRPCIYPRSQGSYGRDIGR
jgi:hypothetical protein